MQPNAIIAAIALVLISFQAAGADIADEVLGVWRVTGVTHRVLQTGELENPLGERPTGVATFSSGGYFTWQFVADRRGGAPVVSQGGYTPRALLFEAAAFGSGRYRVEDDVVFLRYEHAWNQVWAGVELIHTMYIEDDILIWTSPPFTTHSGVLVASVSTYERDCGVRLPWLRSKTKGGGPFAGYTPVLRSGDTLPKEGVFAVALKPAADVVFFAGRSDPSHGYGGTITFEHVPAGRYGIVLSEEARVTAVQHRPFLTIPVDQWRTEANCLSMAEIAVEAGPMSLQIRGAVGPLIKISMIKVSD